MTNTVSVKKIKEDKNLGGPGRGDILNSILKQWYDISFWNQEIFIGIFFFTNIRT